MREGRSAAAAVTLMLAAAACSGKGSRDRKDEPPPAVAGHEEPSAATTASAPGGAVTGGAAGAVTGRRPNILFVVADDQRADSVACMPRLQKMMSGGVTFSDYFAATPLCCPGRTTLLTGLYAHNHGVLQNGDNEDGEATPTPGAVDFVNNGNEERLIAKWLKAVGYRTAMFGKYLNGYDIMLRKKKTYVPPHWDDWHVFPHAEYFDFQLVERAKGDKDVTRTCWLSGSAKGKRKDEKHCRDDADKVIDDGQDNYSTDVLKDRAVAFIRSAAKEKTPFFMYFAPKAPHGPFLSPARYQPDRKKVEFTKDAMDKLGACPLFDWKDRPASFLEKDVSDKPKWVQELSGKHTAAQMDDVRRGQLVSVLATEDALEAMLAALDEVGERDSTVLIYLADNGYAWGEHGYKGKNCAYESCSHVPFLFLDPRQKAQRGRTLTWFASDIDQAPTLAEIGGAQPVDVDGASLWPLIANQKNGPTRNELLTECWGNGNKAHPDTMAALRTRDWLYIEHYEDTARSKLSKRGGSDELELYDLQKDRSELDNLLMLDEPRLQAKGYDRQQIGQLTTGLKSRMAQLAHAKP